MLLVPAQPTAWSGQQQLKHFPQQDFLVRKVARPVAELKKKTCQRADETSCRVNGHLAQWVKTGLHSHVRSRSGGDWRHCRVGFLD